MNSVQILGNLARDPEVRYTKTGRAVATFTVAATNTYVDSATNETKEQTALIVRLIDGKHFLPYVSIGALVRKRR